MTTGAIFLILKDNTLFKFYCFIPLFRSFHAVRPLSFALPSLFPLWHSHAITPTSVASFHRQLHFVIRFKVKKPGHVK